MSKRKRRRQYTPTVSKWKKRFARFAIKLVASIIIFVLIMCIAFISPSSTAVINSAICYNTDFNQVKTSVKELILKYSPTPTEAPAKDTSEPIETSTETSTEVPEEAQAVTNAE